MEILSVQAVDKYYDYYNKKETWSLIHSGKYPVKERKDAEPTDMEVNLYKNKYGDTYLEDGMCVQRHIIIDTRGWIIEWLDEESYANVYIPDWTDLTDFKRRFSPIQLITMTKEQYEAELDALREGLSDRDR